MEKFTISFEFENGIIKESPTIYPDFLPVLNGLKRLVEPVILKGNLSGIIELKVFEKKIKINHINIKPFEYVPQLMEALENSNSFTDFELN